MAKVASSAAATHWTVPVARWSHWPNVIGSSDVGIPDDPDVKFVEPMLRRRLSSLAKSSLKVAHDCVHDLPRVRFVYASRHGELKRTTGLLDALAREECPSPTAFSLAVLNATPGLFSILRRDTSAAIAVSAGGSSFGFGLIEAALQFANDPTSPVLFVYADEPVPDIYEVEPSVSGPANALAMLLSDNPQLACMCRVKCCMSPSDLREDDLSHSLAFTRSLAQNEDGAWCGEGRHWTWSIQ